MSSVRPLLFMDVDGVLNCPGGDPAAHAEHRTGEWGRVMIPHNTTTRLRALEQHFECVWATAWFHRAPTDLAPILGVGHGWPVLPWENMKLPAILPHAAGRRWAFVDDDIAFELRELNPDDRRAMGASDHLLVEPNTTSGLDDTHVKALCRFSCS